MDARSSSVGTTGYYVPQAINADRRIKKKRREEVKPKGGTQKE